MSYYLACLLALQKSMPSKVFFENSLRRLTRREGESSRGMLPRPKHADYSYIRVVVIVVKTGHNLFPQKRKEKQAIICGWPHLFSF